MINDNRSIDRKFVAMKRRRLTILSLLVAACALAQTTVQPLDKCRIDGVATAAGTGTPLAGVEILVFEESGKKAPLDTQTDSEGHFAIDELSPGRYLLKAERSGYVSQIYTERGKGRQGMVLVLHPGQVLTGINFRMVATGVVSGHILGDDGEPLPGSIVRTFLLGYSEGKRRLIVSQESVSDDRGEYRIFGLRPGHYYLCAGAPGARPANERSNGAPPEQRHTPTFFPNVHDSGQATSLDVQPGNELAGIDITLQRMAAYHLRGTVFGLDRNSRYSRITLRPIDPCSDILYRNRDIVLDAKGTFDFGGVVQGSYVLFAVYARGGSGYSAWRHVDVVNADVDAIRLAPTAGLRLAGRIAITGGSRFDYGKLSLNLRPGLLSPTESVSARINSDGSFEIEGIGQEVYDVEVGGLPNNFYLKSIRLGDEEVRNNTIDLSQMEPTPASLGITLDPNGGQIEGVVREENDQLAKATVVTLSPKLEQFSDPHLFRETTTDGNGHFVIRGIAPGEYNLFAWDQIETGAYRDPAFLKPYLDRGTVLTLRPNEQRTVELHTVLSVDERLAQ